MVTRRMSENSSQQFFDLGPANNTHRLAYGQISEPVRHTGRHAADSAVRVVNVRKTPTGRAHVQLEP